MRRTQGVRSQFVTFYLANYTQVTRKSEAQLLKSLALLTFLHVTVWLAQMEMCSVANTVTLLLYLASFQTQ